MRIPSNSLELRGGGGSCLVIDNIPDLTAGSSRLKGGRIISTDYAAPRHVSSLYVWNPNFEVVARHPSFTLIAM